MFFLATTHNIEYTIVTTIGLCVRVTIPRMPTIRQHTQEGAWYIWLYKQSGTITLQCGLTLEAYKSEVVCQQNLMLCLVTIMARYLTSLSIASFLAIGTQYGAHAMHAQYAFQTSKLLIIDRLSAPIYSLLSPPSIPLAVRSPYTNIWSATFNGSTLNNRDVTFWNHVILGWSGIIRVDSQSCEYLGDSPSIAGL
jgi:hypothetical protein